MTVFEKIQTNLIFTNGEKKKFYTYRKKKKRKKLKNIKLVELSCKSSTIFTFYN